MIFRFIGFIIKFALSLLLLFVMLSVATVIAYKFISPPVTPHMIIRTFEGMIDGKFVGIDKTWRGYEDISPNLYRAIIGAEDARFMSHNGVDWRAVEDAKRYNARHKGRKKRGASTVTMQTAKNTFLPHSRTYIRKGVEVYFTYLIEYIWGKKRILEVYANVVEWGPGIYGAEAASRKFFGKSAADLTRREAALLAAVLPNPHRWSPAKPTPYINKRVAWIMGRMNSVAIPKTQRKKRS